LALKEELAKAGFVRIRAYQQRDFVLVALLKGGDGVLGQKLAVHCGRVAGV